jgi:hypothetical protein
MTILEAENQKLRRRIRVSWRPQALIGLGSSQFGS